MVKTLRQDQAIAQRRTEVSQLIDEGYTLRGIARKLNVSAMTISRDYHAILGELAAERKTYGEAILQDQLQKLDRLIDKYETRYETDERAANVYLKALDQRARLLDLYPKQEVQPATTNNYYALVFDTGAAPAESAADNVIASSARMVEDRAG